MKQKIFQIAFLGILVIIGLGGCDLELGGGDPDTITCDVTFIIKDTSGNLVQGASINATAKSVDFDSSTPEKEKSKQLTSDSNGRAEWHNVHFTIYPFGWISFSAVAIKQINGVWYDKTTSFRFNRSDGPKAEKTVILVLD